MAAMLAASAMVTSAADLPKYWFAPASTPAVLPVRPMVFRYASRISSLLKRLSSAMARKILFDLTGVALDAGGFILAGDVFDELLFNGGRTQLAASSGSCPSACGTPR